ncbi:hypothetical protein DYB37_009858 [Aphanomyces astaci]|uniref:Major facilitator superfamily (MFS) profile domain-containing protein n=1 Tax=Aphanomyces astaci TaxID=112090 RepID=A0A418E237_APHAT|nr:hypothetical protein DYB37_009858 [Aphanomyces astaci]
MLYDAGQIAGGFLGGYVTDKAGIRSPIVFAMIGAATTAISADLGSHDSLREDTAALATVTGIIDGTGSVGAAIVQFLVGYLAGCHPVGEGGTMVCTWGPVFVLLQVSGILSCVCLVPLVANELKRTCRR